MLSAGGSSRPVRCKAFAAQMMWYLKLVSLKIQTVVSYFHHYSFAWGTLCFLIAKQGFQVLLACHILLWFVGGDVKGCVWHGFRFLTLPLDDGSKGEMYLICLNPSPGARF